MWKDLTLGCGGGEKNCGQDEAWVFEGQGIG